MSARRPPRPDAAPAASLGTMRELLARQGVHASTTAPAPASPPPAAAPTGGREPDTPDLARCGKVVVRRERKGHGGKTATVVAGLGLPARDLDRLARGVRRALGCGASVDGDLLVVQGDQATRVQAWLAAHGAPRIVLGN